MHLHMVSEKSSFSFGEEQLTNRKGQQALMRASWRWYDVEGLKKNKRWTENIQRKLSLLFWCT